MAWGRTNMCPRPSGDPFVQGRQMAGDTCLCIPTPQALGCTQWQQPHAFMLVAWHCFGMCRGGGAGSGRMQAL
eukprot:366433-Chlamydomonas_euryale.AAC.9